MRWLLLLLLALHLPCPRVPAQIVNIEDKRRTFDERGTYGNVDLGGSLNKNNNTVVTLNGALRVDRVRERTEVLLLADYRLVQVSGDNALNSGFGHLRFGYDLSEAWRWETFTQVQYSEQLRLRLRFLLGSGPRLRLYEREGRRAYLGVLAMYEYDEVAEGKFIYQDFRASSYLTLAVTLYENVNLSNTTYYQPVLYNWQSRISSVTGIEISLGERLSLTSNYSITHDARLVQGIEGVPPTTYSWTNGLRFRWK